MLEFQLILTIIPESRVGSMGLYLDPENESFADLIQTDIYVDKTGLISYMNSRIGKEKHLIASSRPRCFGKTMAVKMLTAYYSRGCDSRKFFSGLEIAKDAFLRNT